MKDSPVSWSLNDDTKILTETDTETFFAIPNFPKPKPRLFSETETEIFFRDQFFRNWNRYFFSETKFSETETLKKLAKVSKPRSLETKISAYIMNKSSCCNLPPNVYISSQHWQHLKTVCINSKFFCWRNHIAETRGNSAANIAHTFKTLSPLFHIILFHVRGKYKYKCNNK